MSEAAYIKWARDSSYLSINRACSWVLKWLSIASNSLCKKRTLIVNFNDYSIEVWEFKTWQRGMSPYTLYGERMFSTSMNSIVRSWYTKKVAYTYGNLLKINYNQKQGRPTIPEKIVERESKTFLNLWHWTWTKKDKLTTEFQCPIYCMSYKMYTLLRY